MASLARGKLSKELIDNVEVEVRVRKHRAHKSSRQEDAYVDKTCGLIRVMSRPPSVIFAPVGGTVSY